MAADATWEQSELSLNDRLPNRARRWKLRARTLTIGRRPLIMGVINVTPDSFSDGDRFFDHQAAIDHGCSLIEQGADLLDIGGESTRPYSSAVPADEELRRVVPVVAQLCRQNEIPVSIDTSKALVAERCIEAGAQIINDVTGLRGDSRMLKVARSSEVGVCAMHMQGTPRTMQDYPTYVDVVRDVFQFLRQRRDDLIDAGIEHERICLDPGIGFGKTHQHNLQLMASCSQFHELTCPILVGPSRKGFIGKVLGDASADRTTGTIGAALSLARQGVQVVRVHDVAQVRNALLLFEACGGIDGSWNTLN